MIEPGTTLLGKYRIERVIARGGMGVVAQAHHLQLDVPVAIKFLLPDILEQPEVVRRFLREAQAAVKLKSEHVCRIIDVGTLETGAPYMVMEYLDGTDLGAVLRSQGPLEPGFAVDLVLQACEALAEAHATGIVHRDIKPSNLFFTQGADGGPLVKLLDFGVSKAPVKVDEGITHSQVLLGTPAYMSPEQLESSKDVDGRTDIWALGVVLYEFVCARRPFHSASFARLVMMICSQPMPPIENVELPAGLIDVIARCLEKQPAHRFQNIADLATALAPHAGTPAQAAHSIERTARLLGLGTGPIMTRLVRINLPVPMPANDTLGETAGEQVFQPATQPAHHASEPGVPEHTFEAPLVSPAEPRRRRGPVIALTAAGVIGLALILARLAQTDSDRPAPPPASAVTPATAGSPLPAVQPLLAPDAGTASAAATHASQDGVDQPALAKNPGTSDDSASQAPDAEPPGIEPPLVEPPGAESPGAELPATAGAGASAEAAPASRDRRESQRERRKRRGTTQQTGKAKSTRDGPGDEREIEDAFETRN